MGNKGKVIRKTLAYYLERVARGRVFDDTQRQYIIEGINELGEVDIRFMDNGETGKKRLTTCLYDLEIIFDEDQKH